MYTGLIWLTDALARGGDPLRLRSALGVLRQMRGVFVISAAQVEPLRDALGSDGPEVKGDPPGARRRSVTRRLLMRW